MSNSDYRNLRRLSGIFPDTESVGARGSSMMLCCVACAACATGMPATASAPSASTATPAAPNDATDERARGDDAAARWKQRPSDPGCRDALVALARAELAAFRLGTCGRIDAERALGSSGDQASRFEQFGEYRVYTAGG